MEKTNISDFGEVIAMDGQRSSFDRPQTSLGGSCGGSGGGCGGCGGGGCSGGGGGSGGSGPRSPSTPNNVASSI